MLAGAIVLQRVKTIAGRMTEIIKRPGAVEHPQPLERALLNIER